MMTWILGILCVAMLSFGMVMRSRAMSWQRAYHSNFHHQFYELIKDGKLTISQIGDYTTMRSGTVEMSVLGNDFDVLAKDIIATIEAKKIVLGQF